MHAEMKSGFSMDAVDIYGRSEGMFILRGVNVFPIQIEEFILHNPVLTGHYPVFLSRPHRMDAMEVHARARLADTDIHDHADALAILIKNRVGVTARVIINSSGSIERSMGKVKRVIDTRPKP
ncbi:MAG: hypothetical protein EXR05_07960 [Acetobacteraceae bacterium]|nr:hypothetical protein [Acetobacteraceae bacterium]MSP29667.1 hypothetical protein [Acetobacteraceae bacterium]